MVKVRQSTYADKDSWERFKLSPAKRGLEVSQALEEKLWVDYLVKLFSCVFSCLYSNFSG